MQEGIEVRQVVTLPTDQVIALYREVGWWKDRMTKRESIPLLIQGSFCFCAAFHQDQLVGIGRVLSDGISDGYIHDLVVKKEYRGRGVGKELVKMLTQFCVDRNLEWIGLVAAPETSGFYEELGFSSLKDYQPMLLDRS